MRSGMAYHHCEQCSPNHLLAMSRLLELPLVVSSREASQEVAAKLVMEEADHVLSAFLQSTFIVAFSSWPVDETWRKHLRYVCGIPSNQSHQDTVATTWETVTTNMEAERLTLTPFLNDLHSTVDCGLKTKRFTVEISLEDQIECFPINISHIHSRFGESAVYNLQNQTTRKYWQQYCKKEGLTASDSDESWIQSYLEHVKTIAASIRAKKLYLIPFFAEQRFFGDSGESAYGGAMTLYCSESLGQSLTAQLVLHQLAGLLFRTIEEPKRILAEGREQQLVNNLSYFGHDSQRLAETSRAILKTGWQHSSAVAGLFCGSLETRSAAYATLVRGATERAVAEENVIDEMRRAVAGGRSMKSNMGVSVQSLMIVELLAVFARICMGEDKSLWAQMGRKLFADSEAFSKAREFAFVNVFSKLPQNYSDLDRSSLIEAMAKFGFDISLGGPRVLVPHSLPATDEKSTVPILTTALRFIFSELLTNLAKHAWPREDLQKVRVDLDVAIEKDTITLNLSSSPGAIIHEEEIYSVIGLSSLRLAIAASGGKTESRQITVSGRQIRDLPLPEGDEKRLSSRIRYPAGAFLIDLT